MKPLSLYAIRQLRSTGWTFADIGKLEGVTRQAIADRLNTSNDFYERIAREDTIVYWARIQGLSWREVGQRLRRDWRQAASRLHYACPEIMTGTHGCKQKGDLS